MEELLRNNKGLAFFDNAFDIILNTQSQLMSFHPKVGLMVNRIWAGIMFNFCLVMQKKWACLTLEQKEQH